MSSHDVDPLAAVGYEGASGFLTVLASFPIVYALIGRTDAGRGGYFDVPVGFHQIVDNPSIWGSSIAIAISIAFFNFFGLAVTKSYVLFDSAALVLEMLTNPRFSPFAQTVCDRPIDH